MPAAAVAVVGLLAGGGTFSLLTGGAVATFLGISGALLGATAASVIAGVVGLAVTYGLQSAFGLNKKPKVDLSAYAQDRKQLIRSSAAPRQIVYGEALVSGPMVFARSTGADERYLHLVVPLAGHVVAGIDTVFLNGIAVTNEMLDGGGMVTGGTYAGLVRIKKHLGTQTDADADLVAEVPEWTSDHKLLGAAYLYLRLEYSTEAFANGLTDLSAIVRGRLVYDPRSETTAYSSNWALCMLDYLRSDFGLACDDDEIDWDAAIAAANVCDELVQLDAGGTQFQPRYALDGSFKLDERPIDVIGRMESAAAGSLAYVQGLHRIYAGGYEAPSVELTLSDPAGAIQITTRPPLSDLFNAVKGTFISPAENFQAVEFPAITDAGFEAEDGERIWQELELPFTADATRAQRLARIMLLRAREPATVSMPMRYASLRLCVWQMIALTVPALGWSAKPFRITQWTFDPVQGQPALVLREETAASWAWLYDDAQPVTPGAATTLINPLAVPPPTDLAVAATTVLQSDGTVLPALVVTWTAPAHAFVTAVEVSWRQALSGGGWSDWQSALVPKPTARWQLLVASTGVSYEIRARAVAGLVRSAWTSAEAGTGAADTTPPGMPGSLTATGITRGVSLRWTNPGDADLLKVEVWERNDLSGTSAKVGESYSDFFVRSGMDPAETRRWKVRAIDRSGNAGSFTAEVTGTSTLLVSDDIGNEVINASHLQASTAVITGSAQIADLIVDRIHLKSAAVSTHAIASWSADVSVDKPISGYAYASLGGVDVDVGEDGRVIVIVQCRGAQASTPGAPVEVITGGEGGGGGGG